MRHICKPEQPECERNALNGACLAVFTRQQPLQFKSFKKTGTFVMFDKNYVFSHMTRAKGCPFETRSYAPENITDVIRGILMPRPTIPESERLTERVAFRITAATKTEYEKRLAASGLKQSEFFRDCVMTDRTEIIVAPQMTADMRESLRLLKNIANNCNQMAHALNTAMLAGLIGPALTERVLNQLSLLLEEAKKTQANSR
uniref:plasmid mobilization protein n=1 Tax=Salmonella sp. 40 TaxID=1179813 RepID=UPI001566C207|nr:plasmid mobilization relaxosome protein MobC [Salmonella sp. 40]